MTKEQIDSMSDSVVKAIQMATAPLHGRIGRLELKIAALESKTPPEAKSVDEWNELAVYEAGSLVRHKGAVYYAIDRSQDLTPGEYAGSGSWEFVTKTLAGA